MMKTKTWAITDTKLNKTIILEGEDINWQNVRAKYEQYLGYGCGTLDIIQYRFKIECLTAPKPKAIKHIMPIIKLYRGRRKDAEALFQALHNYAGKNKGIKKLVKDLHQQGFQYVWQIVRQKFSTEKRNKLFVLLGLR